MIRISLCIATVAVLVVASAGEARAHWGRHRAHASWGSHGGAAYAAGPVYQPAAVYQPAPLAMPAPVYQPATYYYEATPYVLQTTQRMETTIEALESPTEAGQALEAVVDDLIEKGMERLRNRKKTEPADDPEEPADEGDCADLKSEVEKLRESVEELKTLVKGSGVAASPIRKKLTQLRADHDRYLEDPAIQAEFARRHDALLEMYLRRERLSAGEAPDADFPPPVAPEPLEGAGATAPAPEIDVARLVEEVRKAAAAATQAAQIAATAADRAGEAAKQAQDAAQRASKVVDGARVAASSSDEIEPTNP